MYGLGVMLNIARPKVHISIQIDLIELTFKKDFFTHIW
jgi:hypothetical protein